MGLGNSKSYLKEADDQECSKLARCYKDHRLHRIDGMGVTEVLLAAKNLHAEKISIDWEVSKWKHICKNLLKHDKKKRKNKKQVEWTSIFQTFKKELFSTTI
jgi:predicted transcriptional regulator